MPTFLLNTTEKPPRNLFFDRDFLAQRAFFTERPELTPTPLRRCPGLARALGLAELLVKDETARFGLNAFKAVGATFAIETLMARGGIHAGDTLVCASEGNHGRAVAHVARRAGCRARVYLSESVAPARVDAIRAEGADAILVRGDYGEAVRVMAREAAAAGWMVISDTSWPGYLEIPRLIALGYTRLMDEDWASDAHPPPDVVFVPGGVGGLLAGVACWGDWRFGARRPRVVCVEPIAAACLQASARSGRPTSVPGPFTTAMGGLRCGEMSPDVFPVIETLVDAFAGIEDDFAFEAMRRLGRPEHDDPAVQCGASGAAALGGLLAMLRDPGAGRSRSHLQLGSGSRVLVLATEGPTDPSLHEEIVARP